MPVTGFDALKRQMDDAGKFTKSLERVKVECNLLDPASVEAGIREMEQAVDREAARYPGNAMVRTFADGTKEAMRNGVREQAAKAQRDK